MTMRQELMQVDLPTAMHGGAGRLVLPAFERWARAVASRAPGDGSDLDNDITMMADLVRFRMIDDPYAVARVIRSFKIGRDLAHDDAVDAVADFIGEHALAVTKFAATRTAESRS